MGFSTLKTWLVWWIERCIFMYIYSSVYIVYTLSFLVAFHITHYTMCFCFSLLQLYYNLLRWIYIGVYFIGKFCIYINNSLIYDNVSCVGVLHLCYQGKMNQLVIRGWGSFYSRKVKGFLDAMPRGQSPWHRYF